MYSSRTLLLAALLALGLVGALSGVQAAPTSTPMGMTSGEGDDDGTTSGGGMSGGTSGGTSGEPNDDDDEEACIMACGSLYKPVCVQGMTLASECHALCMGHTSWVPGTCEDGAVCLAAYCETCAFEMSDSPESMSAAEAQECLLCRDGKYLHDGACLDSCPAGHHAEGAGSFGRTCEPFLCGDEFCHSCIDDVCEFCNGGRYLHNGECLDSCPAGMIPEGSGQYRRTCREANCLDSVADCAACEETDASQCQFCGASKYLLDNECVASCPAGYTAEGSGTFKRFCEAFPCGDEFCHSCVADVCEFCNGGKHLHNGECLDSCPAGMIPEGSGQYRRFCREATCLDKDDGCVACEESMPTDCAVCGSNKHLHQGSCVDTCPTGFDEEGFGTYGRYCEEHLCGDEFCHRCEADVCTLCNSGKFLHEGACVDSCPSGFEGVGTGTFSRFCRVRTCLDEGDGCVVCDSAAPADCLVCGSAKHLHQGSCVDTCPTGFDEEGFGTFGRYCEEHLCGDEFCHKCEADVCVMCNAGKFLHEGVCVDSCPSGFEGVGTGTFARSCRQLTCKDLDENCNACDETDSTVCVQCRNSKYLTADGQCADSCPAGRTELGFGSFGRTCSSCTEFCHSCNEETGVCEFCNSAKFLFENACVDSCPAATTVPRGTGTFRRTCEPIPACGVDCHRCDEASGTCEMCRNAMYLHEGACVASCPVGFIEQGTGNFNRLCV